MFLNELPLENYRARIRRNVGRRTPAPTYHILPSHQGRGVAMGELGFSFKEAVKALSPSNIMDTISKLPTAPDPLTLLKMGPKNALKKGMDDLRDAVHIIDTQVGQYIDPGARFRVDYNNTKDEIKSLQDEATQLQRELISDPTNAAKQARLSEISTRLQELGGHMKKLMGQAKIVLQIVSIVASFFTGGTAGPAMFAAIKSLEQGAIAVAKKMIYDFIMKSIATKMKKRAADRYAHQVADLVAQTKRPPTQDDYEKMLWKYINEGSATGEPIAPGLTTEAALEASKAGYLTAPPSDIKLSATKPSPAGSSLLPLAAGAAVLLMMK